MGGDINSADYAYSIVDFSITAYGGYSGMKIVPKYNRLIRPSLGNRLVQDDYFITHQLILKINSH